MRAASLVLIFPLTLAVTWLRAQETPGAPGPRRQLPRAEEIALARSAAPRTVSAGARVWILSGGRYVVADSGNTAVQCYVSRGWPQSLEPHCFDEEGARTIMPIEMRQTELLHRGIAADSVQRLITAGIARGEFRMPQRPAMSWMQSAAQILYDDDGTRVGPWKPHIMIYYPYLTTQGVGTGSNQDVTAGIVVSPGTPLSNLMIVVPEAVHPAGDSAAAAGSVRR